MSALNNLNSVIFLSKETKISPQSTWVLYEVKPYFDLCKTIFSFGKKN